jgi:hypothetical protein
MTGQAPPPPSYPPTAGAPTTWWAPAPPPPPAPEPEPEPEPSGRDWTWLRPTAIATGAAAAPAWLHVMHIAGDRYGVALAAVTAAAVADHRRRTWLTRAILTAIAAGSMLCLPAVADTLTYLTGAHS